MPFMGKDKTLFRLFGLPVKANFSWLFLVALVVYTLAERYFPTPQALGPGADAALRWGLAVAGAIGLFASLIAHEMCHSLVARHTGMQVSGITLFIFGGVSELEEEPPTAPTEFFMAVVGPLASVLIGCAMLLAWVVGNGLGWSQPVQVLLHWLWFINFLLAGFNSLPAFPLDGGRVVRSVLWAVTDDLRLATRVAGSIGSFFGMAMIFLGIFALFNQYIIEGVWLMVIGFFLRQAAMSSFQMVLIRQNLEGHKVGRFMTTDPVTVPADTDLETFVEDYVFHHRFSYYPVVDADGRLVGLVDARAPREIDSDQWPSTPVGQIAKELEPEQVLDPETDAVDALGVLRLRDQHRAVVVDDGRPVGIVSLRDLLQFLALKIDLEPRRLRR